MLLGLLRWDVALVPLLLQGRLGATPGELVADLQLDD